MEAVLTHGSLFAGIGGQDLGFERVGWRTIWQVENEPFCRAVLETRFPEADRSVDDVREAGSRNLARVDCITAGVPCQDVSVAGKRAGLKGERTGLFFEFARILQELRPAWFVFENVPGLLSSNRGRDFAEVLRVLMVKCGYGVCWRVLDSQFFGVAQRRRRVFIVGRFGKPCPAEVLFESESGAGDSPQGRKAGAGTPEGVARSLGGVGGGQDYGANKGTIIIEQNTQCSTPHLPSQRAQGTPNYAVGVDLQNYRTTGNKAGTLRGEAQARQNTGNAIIIQDVRGHREKKQHGIGIQEGGPSYTLDGVSQHAVAFSENQRGEIVTSKRAHQLTSGGGKPGQGYPAVAFREQTDCLYSAYGTKWNGNAAAENGSLFAGAPLDPDGMRDFAGLPQGLDSARYRALGNAWTTQVAEWIAQRINKIGGA